MKREDQAIKPKIILENIICIIIGRLEVHYLKESTYAF